MTSNGRSEAREIEACCYRYLVGLFHPEGLRCPRCRNQNWRVHRRDREPVLDFRCQECHCVFNAWTATPLQRTRRRPSQIIVVLRGMRQQTSTAQLAREMSLPRPQVHCLRQKLHRWLHSTEQRDRYRDLVIPDLLPSDLRPEEPRPAVGVATVVRL